MHSNRRTIAVLAATTVIIAAAAAPAVAAGSAVREGHLVPLDMPDGAQTYDVRMNERGDVVGHGGPGMMLWRRGESTPTIIDVPGSPRAINEKGHVVGHVYGDGSVFLWRDGAVSHLRPGAGEEYTSVSINDRDQVAGSVTGPDGISHAFLWQRGRRTLLPTPSGLQSRSVGINNLGQIVGVIAPPGTETVERAVLWQDGRMTELGTLGGGGSVPRAINNSGQVVGVSSTASAAWHPFLWQDGRMTDLLAGTTATSGGAGAISDTGLVAGSADFGSGYSRPMLWRDGQMIDIGLPGHTGGASAINDRGDVTGRTWPEREGTSVPFRWRAGNTTLYTESAGDVGTIVDMTVVGIDRRGTVCVEQETTRAGYIVLRSA